MVRWWIVFAYICEVRSKCTVASLSLRHGALPIDLRPLFRPDVHEYEATLDFHTGSFSIDVRPQTGCDMDHVPTRAIPVVKGGSQTQVFFSRNIENGEKTQYTVKVTRLLGSETELHSLSIDMATLSPAFSPEVRSYTAALALSKDQIRIQYRLLDNQQHIRFTAQPQVPTASLNSMTTTSTTTSHEVTTVTAPRRPRNATETSRRLGATGEMQYADHDTTFLIDVGFARRILITLESADAEHRNMGTYEIVTTRPGCNVEAPYFDASKRVCVLNCPARFYAHDDIHRCSKCSEFCRECRSLVECTMCELDSADFVYSLEKGACTQLPNHIFKKYLWWCIGFGLLMVAMLMVGLVGISRCCSRRKHYNGSSSDNDYAYERKGRKRSDSYDYYPPPY